MLRGVAKRHERLCDKPADSVIPIPQPRERNLAVSVSKTDSRNSARILDGYLHSASLSDGALCLNHLR